MKIIAALILFIVLASAEGTEAQEQAPFIMTYALSTPYLSPGDRNAAIDFMLQNNRDVSLSNVKIYLFLKYPFSASIPPNNKLGELSYPGYLISGGSSGDEYTPYFDLAPRMSHWTSFRIDVDRNAKYGEYDLVYRIYYEKGEYSGKITLAVKGDTLVEIKNVTAASNNTKIEPGDVFKIAVSFENIGDNNIKWLKLMLNPVDKAIVPLSSDAEQVFKDLPHGSKRESEFWFSIEKNAAIKNYPIDLVLSYMDERGVTFNETKLVGVVVAGRAALDIAKKTTEPARIKENQPFTLTVKIENTGTGDAKGVTANFESQLEGDTIAYLGEIKRDDYSNAIFTLDADGSGKKTGILRITYEDDVGIHEIQKELILIVNPGDRQDPLPALIGIIAIAVVVFYWKQRKK
ncbi:MAG: hypothetical protein Q8O41_01405 [Candidatus Methanoperedens sp.]|nr:hypothetical protein [Candidatus Methanoperedens sp.]